MMEREGSTSESNAGEDATSEDATSGGATGEDGTSGGAAGRGRKHRGRNEELEEVLRGIESKVKSRVWLKNKWRDLKRWASVLVPR